MGKTLVPNLANIELLNEEIKKSGIKKCALADRAKINRTTFNQLTTKGGRHFFDHEIVGLSTALRLSDEKQYKIFLEPYLKVYGE